MSFAASRCEEAGRAPSDAEFHIHRGYLPGVIGRAAELHGRYYAEAWGSGAPFESLIAREFGEFMEGYDERFDLLLSANQDGRCIGTIAIYGRRRLPEGAQLRFFIVDPDCHGCGAGKALLAEALAWCREQGLAKVFLWTVDGLPASRRLYEKAGFRVTERVPDDRYTVLRDNLRLELEL
ncbi:GNAT family N-acetyltransferase [Desulfovibrio sp. TomC]|uniref:GNAT family N-acetyltransferase n=1 Tax=Desulfovibrio sp. TomC TaxID=1562888 RepID=UPI000573AC6D|nr:GNAT family N-acetyltransferase [Desulfovibrio sp. TomC]KHK03244.1 acetyltransferase [Desulfovibrio sp. TomC]